MRRMVLCALSAVFMFWAAVNAQQPADPMENVSPMALLQADQFDKLEDFYAYYFKNYNPKVVNTYRPTLIALDRIPYSEDLLPHFNKWVEAKPNSFVALLLRGEFYIQHAWAARGSDFGYTVSRQGAMLMDLRLQLADTDLTSVTMLNPSIPFPYASLITIDMGLQRGLMAGFKHLNAARRIDASYYLAYNAYLYMNTPRWGGSTAMVKQIAQQYADSLPGSVLPLLWTDYHEEMAHPTNMGKQWWSNPNNWKQVDEIYQKMIDAATEPQKTSLRCQYLRQASDAGKIDIVRQQLELVGANWTESAYNRTSKFYYIHQAWPNINEFEWVIKRATDELKQHPDTPNLYRVRGIAEFRNKQLDASLQDLSHALKLDAGQVDAWDYIARICDRTGKPKEAVESVNHWLHHAPNDQGAILIKGKNLIKLGKSDDAEALYHTSLKMHPSMTNICREYCVLLAKKKNYAEVIKVADGSKDYLDPKKDRLIAFVTLGIRAYAKMELNNPEAVEEFGELLTIEDKETDAEAALGKMYLIGGTWEPYKARIKEAMERNIKDKQGLDRKLRLVVFSLGSPSWPEAVTLGESLTKQSPDNRAYRHQLAKAYMMSKRYPESLKIYQKLYAEDPNDLDAMLGIGHDLAETGDLEAAIKIGDEFFEKHKNKASEDQISFGVDFLSRAKEKNSGKTTTESAPRGPMSLSSPELRELAQKLGPQLNVAVVVAVNNIEANPASLDTYSDFLYFTQFRAAGQAPYCLQVQHAIELAEKRNGPSATPMQLKIFEDNKNKAMMALAKRDTYDIAKTPNADPKSPFPHYMTARTLLRPNMADNDPARAIKEAEEGVRLGGDPVRGQEYIMVAQERLGNMEESRKVAQEILKKDPKNACARLQIMWLDRVKTPKK